MMRWQRFLADTEATAALGAALARALDGEAGGVIFLEGDLGAGKTTLARGLLRALGVEGPIRSPTYTLLEPYQLSPRPLLHMDLYRLQDPEELDQLGLADQPPEDHLWLVEWPGRGAGRLPPPDLQVSLVAEGQGRRAQVELAGAGSERAGRLRRRLAAIFETEP